MSDWQTHASRTVYENPWITVREDDVTRPDGSRGVYGVPVLRHPAVFVVPVTEAEEVVMVRLFRYPIGRWSLEVPAGGTDGEEPLVAARRELAEEAGIRARSWTPVGSTYSLNGLADAPGQVFLARDLSAVDDVAEVAEVERSRREEGITDVRRVPWAELPGLVRAGELTDSESISALQLARWALDA